MADLLVRYLKYVGTSLVGTSVETLVLWLLSDYVFNRGWLGEYLISPVIAFQCAVAVNFVIFYFYVWKDRRSEIRRKRSFWGRYLAYNLSCCSVYIIRYGLIVLVERCFGWDVVICNLVAMCLSGVANFILSNNLIFRKRTDKMKGTE